MGKDYPVSCPKCGSYKLNTYRHPNAKLWCTECEFVLRDEGSTTLNLYIPDILCTNKIWATDVFVECPYCGHRADGWLVSPQGRTTECDDCGKTFKINPDATIEYKH